MAINFAIDDNVPDGTQITISQLDDHIKFHKRDVKERMDDSILDTSAGSWLTSTTPKHLKTGLARIHVTSAAAKPTVTAHDAGGVIAGLKSNQLWARSDAPVTGQPSFQYYDGAAWQHVPIGGDNILAGSVTTTKLGTGLIGASIAEVTDSANNNFANSLTWAAFGTLSISYTPAAATSFAVIYAQFIAARGAGTSTGAGFRLRKTTAAAATVAKVIERDFIASEYKKYELMGVITGVTGAQTVRVEYVHQNGNSTMLADNSITIDGEAMVARIGGFVINAT